MNQTSPRKNSTTTELPASVDVQVLEAHPGTKLALLSSPATSYSDTAAASDAEQAVLAAVRSAFPEESDLKGSPEDVAYRDFYRAMGLKAAQVSTPVKQALRVQRNETYQARGPVVDIAMEIEYSTLVSFQVYAANRVTEPLRFALARGDEPIGTTRGEDKRCKTGELLLLSGEDVMHSCYYGNDPKFLLREDDRTALIRVMGVPGIPRDRFAEAVVQMSERVSATDTVLLDEGSPEGVLSLNTTMGGGG